MVNKLNTFICYIGAALLGYIQRFAGSAIRGSIPTGSGRWRSRNVASRVHLGSGREDTETRNIPSDSAQPLLFEVVFTRFHLHTVLILSVSILLQGLGDALIQ
jgi:hypothetical protein